MNRSLRKVKFFWNQFVMPKEVKPPYRHACQIGDPVLRRITEKVKPEDISSKEFKNIVYNLVKTMRLYNACGLSAPQIGVPLQVFCAEITEPQYRLVGPTQRKTQQIEVFPLKIFINPELKVIDHGLLTSNEGCCSTACFQAEVPRFKEVLVTGLDANGKAQSWQAKYWSARIIQHEMDHLKGILFTDRMDPKTLCNDVWHEVNQQRGRTKLVFQPN